MKRLVKRDEWGHPIQEWNSDELLDSVECQVRRVRR
jgi:hypothetical protein